MLAPPKKKGRKLRVHEAREMARQSALLRRAEKFAAIDEFKFPEKAYIDISEAADILHMTRQAVWFMIKRNEIPFDPNGSKFYVPTRDLALWVADICREARKLIRERIGRGEIK
jgi:hypothetical protein